MGKPVKHDGNFLIPVWLLGSFPERLRVTGTSDSICCCH